MTVKAIYRVAELAEMCGVNERTVRRWLEKKSVRTIRIGRTILVPLSSFRESMPELWEAIRLERTVRGS